jgi:hypothetical protein
MQELTHTFMAVGTRRARRNRSIAAGAAIAAALGAILFAGREAYAYGSLTPRYAVVDTDNCARLEGTLPIQTFPNGCELDDSWDGTFFEKDAGGEAIKVELRDGNDLVAKVEWHPYGEYLWAYDTRGDGDTVYVDFYCFRANTLIVQETIPAQNPPRIWNRFDIPEGASCSFDVYDDSARTILIWWGPWGAAVTSPEPDDQVQ